MENLMPQAHDFSKSLVPFDNDTTLVAVIELSQSSWLIAGSVPVSRITLSDEAESTVFDGLPASASQTL
jgi:hypothetical protein